MVDSSQAYDHHDENDKIHKRGDYAVAHCELPPLGWYCTRGAGHGGPCAGHPLPTDSLDAPAESAFPVVAAGRQFDTLEQLVTAIETAQAYISSTSKGGRESTTFTDDQCAQIRAIVSEEIRKLKTNETLADGTRVLKTKRYHEGQM